MTYTDIILDADANPMFNDSLIDANDDFVDANIEWTAADERNYQAMLNGYDSMDALHDGQAYQ